MDGGTLTALTDAAQTLGVVGVGLIISLAIVMALVVLVVVPSNRAQTETNKALLANSAEVAAERKALQTQVNDLNKTVGVLQDEKDAQAAKLATLEGQQVTQKTEFDRELQKARAEIAELNRKLETANQSLAGANATIVQLTRQNDDLNTRLKAIEAERDTLKGDNADKDAKIRQLTAELEGVHVELRAMKERVRELEKKPATGPLVSASPPVEAPAEASKETAPKAPKETSPEAPKETPKDAPSEPQPDTPKEGP